MEPVDRTNAPIRFGVFEVDARTGELRKSGTRLRIQDQPFQLLLALLEHPGELVTREELRQRIWPAESFGDFDHAVNVAVAKLRAALGDSPDAPRYVETLHRRGYRFVYPLTASEEQQPVAAQSAASDLAALPQAQLPPDANSPAPAAKSLQASWSRPALAIACSLAVLATAFSAYRFSQRSNSSSSPAKIVQISEWHKPIHDARLSPDGHMIAFDSPVNGISQVFVMLTSGGVPRQLTDDHVDKVVSTFSADGSELYYSPNISLDELWSVPTLGGPVRHLLSAYYAIPSPDGAYLYYATSDDAGIFRADKTGLHSQTIFQPTDDRFWNVPALVFPDGKRLVALRGWTDGNFAELSTIDLTNRTQTNLGVTVDADLFSGNPDLGWLEPGKSVMFSHTLNGLTNLWSFDLSSHSLTQMTTGIGPDYSPMRDPAGNGIYYVNGRTSAFLSSYDVDSKESLDIAEEDSTQPEISLDAKRVMYATIPAQHQMELWVSDLMGAHRVKLASAVALTTGTWARDNFHLSYISFETGSTSKAYTVAADGSDLHQLPPVDGRPTSIVWDRDQKSLYITAIKKETTPRAVWKTTLDGSPPELIAVGCGDVTDQDSSGSYLLAVRPYGARSGLYQVSLADKTCNPILPGVNTLGGIFSPDGKSILYAVPSAEGSQVLRQAWLNGNLIGKPKIVMTLPFTFPINHGGNAYDFSRDLSKIVYVRPTGHSDVYALRQK